MGGIVLLVSSGVADLGAVVMAVKKGSGMVLPEAPFIREQRLFLDAPEMLSGNYCSSPHMSCTVFFMTGLCFGAYYVG